MKAAKHTVESPKIIPKLTWGGGVGTVEIVESVPDKGGETGSHSTYSTLSTGADIDRAVYPPGSWFERYMDYARGQEESADSYLIGAIVPVFSAHLGRRISFAWGERWIYPNLFSMLAGKPGDRKSSAINLAGRVALHGLEPRQFLPDALSAEALFDEYDENRGGSPDKILIADDANPFLGMLQKSNYGERVGQRLLNLYDCKGLLEAFRRNNNQETGNARREIAVTSTSMVLGATFNICQFQGHEIRSGLQRRFLYYVAEKHGRFIPFPPKSAHLHFLEIADRLKLISGIKFLEFSFSPEAAEFWTNFQMENRKMMADAGFDNEAHVSRLNGQPDHVLKLAMIFELSVWVESGNKETLPNQISLSALKTAVGHAALGIEAGQVLDEIANRARIQQDADLLLAKIAVDFRSIAENGVIQLTRTDLTSKYAHHSNRAGGFTTGELYSRIIPNLIRRHKAQEISRPGKQSSYAFRSEIS